MKGSGGSPAPSAQAKGSSVGGSALAAPGISNNDPFGAKGYTDTLG